MRISVTMSPRRSVMAAETPGCLLACGVVALIAAGCASAPPAPAVPLGLTYEQKLSSILRLEDERRLREPAPQTIAHEPLPRGRRAIAPAEGPPASPQADLIRLLTDPEARVRRRAALAVGRVGLREGVPPLAGLLADGDPEVRQMAAFALGLIADVSGKDPLVAALNDESPLVKGSAAEALGLIGDASAADAIARMAAQVVASGAVAQPPSDDQDSRRDTSASALRLAMFSLARLKAYAPLASAVLDAGGQPRVRWWPLAFALQ